MMGKKNCDAQEKIKDWSQIVCASKKRFLDWTSRNNIQSRGSGNPRHEIIRDISSLNQLIKSDICYPIKKIKVDLNVDNQE